MDNEFYKITNPDGYEIRTKLNNQVLKLSFYRESESREMYSLGFSIANKLKLIHSGKLTLQSTGKMGLEGLLWAKSKILPFIEYLKGIRKDQNLEVIIITRWDNNKRRNVYERGLRSLGFYFKMIDNKKVLYRRF